MAGLGEQLLFKTNLRTEVTATGIQKHAVEKLVDLVLSFTLTVHLTSCVARNFLFTEDC